MELQGFRRGFTPDLEAAPRDPVAATGLTTYAGKSFILVREAIGQDHAGRMVAWFIWRDEGCVGYVGCTIASSTQTPFTLDAPISNPNAFINEQRVDVWRARLTDGSGQGPDAGFARAPSRGQGLMTASLLEIIRDVSSCGWALGVNLRAMTAEAKRVWSRVVETPGVVVRRSSALRECAFTVQPRSS